MSSQQLKQWFLAAWSGLCQCFDGPAIGVCVQAHCPGLMPDFHPALATAPQPRGVALPVGGAA